MSAIFTIEYRLHPTAHNPTRVIRTTEPNKFLCLGGTGFSRISMSEEGKVQQRLEGAGVTIMSVYVLTASEKQVHYKSGGQSSTGYHLSDALQEMLTPDVPEVLM